MNSLPIRIIATDIDGTMLNNQDVLTERNLRAIRESQARGIVFAIASGRFPENVYVMTRQYGISCPIIGSNGARVLDENRRVIAQHPMDAAAARQVLGVLIDMGADFFIFGSEALCTSRTDLLHHSELDYGDQIPALGFSYLRGLDAAKRMVETPVYKFYICNNVPLAPVYDRLRSIPQVDLTRSSRFNLEVMPRGVDKAGGVRDLADALGIPLSQVMTLGDEDNDVSMLKAVGYGVAMANGSQTAKDAAFFVTDDNDRDGFAKAIERFALMEAE